MNKFKIFDMVALEGKKFTADDFRNSGLVLITNITESNIEPVITIAKSAEVSQAITAGILSCNINLLNYRNMKKFLDHADAVILLSLENNEYSARTITQRISDPVTKDGFVNLGIEDVKDTLRNAGTVYFGTGTAKSFCSSHSSKSILKVW